MRIDIVSTKVHEYISIYKAINNSTANKPNSRDVITFLLLVDATQNKKFPPMELILNVLLLRGDKMITVVSSTRR